MINVLDIDRGDVVGEEDEFVGVEFFAELARQILRLDVSRLQKPRHERSRSRERIDHVDVSICQRLSEFLIENILDGVDDEIHAFNGRINDAELFGHARERCSEESVVEFINHALFAFGVVNSFGAFGNGFVEFVERRAFPFRNFFVKQINGLLHCL